MLFLSHAYYPLISPLWDADLQFAQSDFTTIAGSNSGGIRYDISLNTFAYGTPRLTTNRFFLPSSLCALYGIIEFSDTQFTSFMIAICMLLGCLGIYGITRHLDRDPVVSGSIILFGMLMYFMNLWSVERLGHVWIWFTYAILPFFIFLGLSYSRRGKRWVLIAYSLVFGIFGFIPHSFILLLIAHLVLCAYIWALRRESALGFLFIPLGIYALLNLPAILLGIDSGFSYPRQVTGESISYLSRNGQLLNLLAFSNNWWPQFPLNFIFDNEPFRVSSISFFMLSFIAFIYAYRKMDMGRRALAIPLLLCILALMLFARGANSDILGDMLDAMAGAGFSTILGPFREWARIGLVMPSMLLCLFALSLPKIDKPVRNILMGLFAFFVIVNMVFSPAWIYLQELYAAVYIQEDFAQLRDQLGHDVKVLWVKDGKGGIPSYSQYGERIDIRVPVLDGIASDYAYGPGFGNPPEPLLDALNIRHVIKVGEAAGYGFWGCEDLGLLEICSSEKAPAPFSVYSGAILADEADIGSISYRPMPYMAIITSDTGSSGYSIAGLWQEGDRPLHVFEAESGFSGRMLMVKDRDSSGGAYAQAIALERDITVLKGGTYDLDAKADGDITIDISGRAFNISRNGSGFGNAGSIYLGEGEHPLRISSTNSTAIDAVWVYESGLFDEGAPASIEGYERLGQTGWHVRLNATRPFLLGFAETYAPGWVARLGNETIRPVKLYGTMNGYWIDRTGVIDIELRYAPQDLFDIGLVLSALTFAGCLGLMIYSWRVGG